ncbi:MAG: peptidoglycan-binding domain-containing protein [Pseudomonadota bacterium]
MKIRVRMLDEFNEPRSNLQFDVRIDDVLQACSSDGNGLVEVEVPAVTKTVELLLEDENIPLEVGAIDPLEEPSGVQARLNNLGYFCGAIDGVVDTLTENAIREFQREHDLEVTGAADDQTLAALRDQFGC